MLFRGVGSSTSLPNQGENAEDRIVGVHSIRQKVSPERLPGDLLHALPLAQGAFPKQAVFILRDGRLDQLHVP